MFKFAFGFTTGIIVGATGLFIGEIILAIVLEDSPETLDYLKKQWDSVPM